MSFEFPPKKDLSNLHFVQKATSPSSSSHCAHGNQPKFKFTLCTLQRTWIQLHTHDEKDKWLWYNVSQVKFTFVMFVLSAFAYVQ
jgi:hypothetical protein